MSRRAKHSKYSRVTEKKHIQDGLKIQAFRISSTPCPGQIEKLNRTFAGYSVIEK